jgi:hypothetical protein
MCDAFTQEWGAHALEERQAPVELTVPVSFGRMSDQAHRPGTIPAHFRGILWEDEWTSLAPLPGCRIFERRPHPSCILREGFG